MKNAEIIKKYAKYIEENSVIDETKFENYNIKKGLRNANGTGVIVGITKIGSVIGYTKEDNLKIAQEGRLFYREYELYDLFEKVDSSQPHRFEQTMYLLLFSQLPNSQQLQDFKEVLVSMQNLPDEFLEDFILRKPSKNIMNQLQRSILCLYTIDSEPDLITIENLTRQALSLIAKFPTLVIASYNAYVHKYFNESLILHQPRPELSIAENILRMLRKDSYFSEVEADILDTMLVIHADHGGGNNSTFTTHVVSSTQTDTYSSISASVGSLKGPKHGGANAMVKSMILALKEAVNTDSEDEIFSYLKALINKEVFDKKGLVYGMGHAIYTISDPRTEILKKKAYQLALEKNLVKEFELYETIERLTKLAFKAVKGEDFEICANVDLYSGLVYEMMDIPQEIYTPLFALARTASWNAHRIEQIYSDKKIIRPAYVSIRNDGSIIQ